MDYNTYGDDSLMALDEFKNVKGCIRTTDVDVPTSTIGVPNSGSEPPIKNPHPFIAARGEAAQNQLCSLANYQVAFTPAQLKKLYKDKKDYQARVQRCDSYEAGLSAAGLPIGRAGRRRERQLRPYVICRGPDRHRAGRRRACGKRPRCAGSWHRHRRDTMDASSIRARSSS
jgi:hypothetical protein